MDNDPFYKPGLRAAPAKPRPGEPLWSLRKNGRTITCELRYHGEYGVEAQFFEDVEFSRGRRFDTRGLAVQWADFERRALEADGWQ